jgi:uncharacterized membrane protein YqgA involved in biofilm formation
MNAVGAVTLLIGLGGVLSVMLVVDSGGLSTQGGVVLLISLVVGTLIGEALKLHDRVESLSGVIERKTGLGGFSRGFVDASVLFCAGAMTIVGSINDGLYGDSSILFVKSTIDGIAALFMAAALGVGVVFSAAFVLVFQGAITLCAGWLAPVLTGDMMDAVSMAGFTIVMCIGLNLAGATKIKTANMVFALPIAALISLLP